MRLTRSDLIRIALGVTCLAGVVVLLIGIDDQKTTKETVVTLLVLFSSTAFGGIITNRVLKSEERDEMEKSFARLLADPQSQFHLKLLFGGNATVQEQGFSRVVMNASAISVPKPSTVGDCYTDILFLGFDESDLVRHADLVERIRNPAHKLRLLLLDPDSKFAHDRGAALKYDNYPTRLRSSLASLEHYFSSLKPKPNCEVRLYNEIPSILSIGTEYNVWFAPLWNQGNVKSRPFCEILRGPKSEMFIAFDENFEAIWEKSHHPRPNQITDSAPISKL